jgi:hypothetical protein
MKTGIYCIMNVTTYMGKSFYDSGNIQGKSEVIGKYKLQKQLAIQYAVTDTAIRAIVKNKTWKEEKQPTDGRKR